MQTDAADTAPDMSQVAQSRAGAGADADGATAPRWRRALALILNRYPELPPAPQGWLARISLGVVALLAAAYAIFFSAYLLSLIHI